MRLKEIKPGMVIHCRTDKEIKAISDAGFTGFLGQDITRYMTPECYVILRERNTADWTNDFQTAADFGKIIEFSDLILPELTAEEAIMLHVEVCKGTCSGCPLYEVDDYKDCEDLCTKNPEKAVELLAKWKSSNEKKDPEIETVDICRIIEIQPDGRKRCVHEEEIKPELPFDADNDVAKILKRYCMEHEGEFIAVHEVVTRVKR